MRHKPPGNFVGRNSMNVCFRRYFAPCYYWDWNPQTCNQPFYNSKTKPNQMVTSNKLLLGFLLALVAIPVLLLMSFRSKISAKKDIFSKCLFLFCQFSTFCPAESNTVSSCPVTLETSAM